MSISQADIDEIIFVNQAYEYVGIGILVTNLIALLVFCSTAQLRKKYQILIFLEFTYLTAGIGRFMAGYYRVVMYKNLPEIPLPINTTVEDCMKSPWLPFLLLGAQWPATICFLIGLERFFAVYTPFFYRARVSDRLRTLVTIIPLAIVLLIMTIAYLPLIIIDAESDRPTSYDCNVDQVFSPNYVDFHQLFTCVAHSVGFVLSVAAYLQARKKSQLSGREGAAMKSEARRVAALLIVTGVAVILVVLPTLATWLNERFIPNLPSLLYKYALITFNINSMTNLPIYLLFNGMFRSQFIYLVTCSKCSLKTDNVIEPDNRKQ